MALAVLSWTSRELTKESSTDNVINASLQVGHIASNCIFPIFSSSPSALPFCLKLVPSEIVFNYQPLR